MREVLQYSLESPFYFFVYVCVPVFLRVNLSLEWWWWSEDQTGCDRRGGRIISTF